MKRLNVKQKVFWVAVGSLALATVVMLFPPFYVQAQGNIVGLGHSFYFTGKGRVDTGLLLMIWFLIFACGGLLSAFLLMTDKSSNEADSK
tara:strand:+ start:2197 stop:2466 length:270 start_codon:yes stop_codon:yes gene_type:complete